MSKQLILGLFLLALLSGCEPVLERQGIPTYAGIRLSESTFPAEISANIASMEAHGLNHLVVELPLGADTSALLLPEVPPHCFRNLPIILDSLAHHQMLWSLVLAPLNRRDVFPLHAPPAPHDWFMALSRTCDSLLSLTHAFPPQRLVIGTDLIPVENERANWVEFTRKIKQADSPVPLFYLISADRVSEFRNWDLLGGIAINYSPSPNENHKRYCRKMNEAISEVSVERNLPVFIHGANLLGDDKTLVFRNRQRFWGEEVRVEGITLNTLYPRIALRDSSSYYQLMGNVEFEEYLKKYEGEGGN